MSKKILLRSLLPLLALLAVAPLVGCYAGYEGGGVGVEVGLPPPALQAEVRVDSPGEGYFWVPGFWDWDVARADWVWAGGGWQRPPHEHAVWVAPRYHQRRGGHWRYERGHWQ